MSDLDAGTMYEDYNGRIYTALNVQWWSWAMLSLVRKSSLHIFGVGGWLHGIVWQTKELVDLFFFSKKMFFGS